MKKTVLISAFILALSLFSSCEKSRRESVIVIDDDAFINGESFTEALPYEEGTTEEVVTEEVTTEPVTDPRAHVKGTIDGKVYTNEFAGMKFTAPSDSKLFSGKVAGTLLDMTGLFGDEEEKSGYDEDADSAFINDAMCMNNLFRGKYVVIQLVEPARISAEVADISVDVFLTVISFGNENPTEPETVTLGGKEFRRIITDSTFDGTPVKRVYYARKEGEFIITVTISELTMEGISAREKNFTALN